MAGTWILSSHGVNGRGCAMFCLLDLPFSWGELTLLSIYMTQWDLPSQQSAQFQIKATSIGFKLFSLSSFIYLPIASLFTHLFAYRYLSVDGWPRMKAGVFVYLCVYEKQCSPSTKWVMELTCKTLPFALSLWP